MSANSHRPWKMLLPLAATLIVAVLWSIYWVIALGVARGEFTKERARQARDGLSLNCSEESWGGYPFRFEYRCMNPDGTSDGKFVLAATELRTVAMAYEPWHLIAFLSGPTNITLQGEVPFHVAHDPVQASIVAQSATSGRITIDIRSLNAGETLKAATLLLSARTSDMQQADYDIAATSLTLSLPDLAPISADKFASNGTISKSQVLVIKTATLHQGDLSLSASGQVELDVLKRPKGQMTLTTNNAPRLLAELRKILQLPEQESAAIAALIAVAGNQVTLTANDGQLYAGPLKIGDLAPLFLPGDG